MPQIQPPRTEAELLERARAIHGRELAEIAAFVQFPPPPNPASGKGWAGQLIEAILGATAGSLPEPDFQLIGVELKTIPLNAKGKPAESTYVCMVPLDEPAGRWEDSVVYHKLARVLWVPVESDARVPLARRRVGSPVLWSPDATQSVALAQDWEELTELVATGRLDEIDARLGVHLQIRPKARDASIRTAAVGGDGRRVRTNPRGFYLRTGFTGGVIAAASDRA